MSLTKAALLIFFGLLVMVVGVAGSTIFSLQWLSGGIAHTDWNTWTTPSPGSDIGSGGTWIVGTGSYYKGTATIDPATSADSELYFVPAALASDAGEALVYSNNNNGWASVSGFGFTMEAKIKVDSWGSDGNIAFCFYRGTQSAPGPFVELTVYQSLANSGSPGSGSVHYSAVNNDWHTWVMSCNFNTKVALLYLDGAPLGQLTSGVLTTEYNPYPQITFGMTAVSGEAKMHTDYFYVDNEVKIPPVTPSPGPTNGALTVTASYNGALVTVQVSSQNTDPQTLQGTTTTDQNNPLNFTNVKPGTYTITGTYSSGTSPQTSSVTVQAGQTASVNLNFGGQKPPPNPNPEDYLAEIRAFFKVVLADVLFKTLSIMGGVILFGVGFIGIVVRPKAAASAAATS